MIGILIFTSISFIIGAALSLTYYFFNKEDLYIEKVKQLLPGYNCGSCGFGSCADMSDNIINKGANPNRCRPMKKEQFESLSEYLKTIGVNVKLKD